METVIINDTAELGKKAAADAAHILNGIIAEKGCARIALSTGASQLPMLNELIKADVDWTKVEAFHLDEYIGIPETHKASFRKYLKERFASKIPLKAFNYVIPEGDITKNIDELTKKITAAPIDLGFIGIGENGHVAFNDPPADFNTEQSYIVVDLNDKCKRQQVGEGWFETVDDVPNQAISMTVHRILSCERIISFVPYAVKAKAVSDTFNTALSRYVPATALKSHPSCTLYLDGESSSLLKKE